MNKFEEEFNYLIELSGKVLTGQIEAEKVEKQRAIFLNEYGKKQQPDIPECIAEFIENYDDINETSLLYIMKDFVESNHWDVFCEIPDNLKKYGRWDDLLYKAIRFGYTVAKEKRFYLKAKELLVVGDYDHVEDLWLDFNKNYTPKKSMAHKFTQKEINSMETGSYEQIEVAE